MGVLVKSQPDNSPLSNESAFSEILSTPLTIEHDFWLENDFFGGEKYFD